MGPVSGLRLSSGTVEMRLFGQPDIERAARSLIKDYGAKAVDKAAENAARAKKQGRTTSQATWTQIALEVRRLLKEPERSR